MFYPVPLRSHFLTLQYRCSARKELGCSRKAQAFIASSAQMLETTLLLSLSTSDGYNVARRKFCGFIWQAEAAITNDLLNIILTCNDNVECSLWRCTAMVTINTKNANGTNAAVCKVVNTFHKNNRSATFTIPRPEMSASAVEIKFELSDVSGYRDPLMFVTDFSKPSAFSDLCIGFEDDNTRIYVNTQYLSIHSQKFAHLFAQLRNDQEKDVHNTEPHSDIEDNSDFDVLSVGSDITATNVMDEEALSKEMPLDGRFSFQRGDDDSEFTINDDGVFVLKNANAKEFLMLLNAIYPPITDVTKENVLTLLKMCYRFGVEHIIMKCEQYLMCEEGQQLFDCFEMLELSTMYRMAALQTETLSKLRTANDVRNLLEDPRMENAHKEVRPVLLELLLQRFKSDSASQRDETSVSVKTTDSSTELNERQTSSAESAEVASLREELRKQEALRMNLEMSLKCARDFIQGTERKVAATEASTSAEGSASVSQLEEKIADVKLAANASNPPPIPPHRKKWSLPGNHDFLKDIVFDTFNASNLSKERNIVLGYSRKSFSIHDIFADLVLPPFTSMKNVVYSFVSHLFTKLYGERVIPIVRSHLSRKIDAFPTQLAERVALAIVIGYQLGEQLKKDDLLIHELTIYLQKQLRKDFELYCANIKAGYLTDSFA
ncbi:hypothetical protein Y032_0256g369 [Ancylostoma ceylanicum]|uniref:BTB domain-containing protein n=1 Tax=Ancylostoma ceylanicum TaxID=53326 RepID=A0A016SAZ3_9BILA|nr:hypothetical protein Y032_0256g369 [Ancylostoma ceylanicum]